MNYYLRGFIILLFSTYCSIRSYSQELPDFILPIKHPLFLTGSFGELRSNHFHAGIDIKSSRGVSGDPIYAVSEGYISRIMVHPGGYGNAMMIHHPNGYTSIYAHLDKFETAIEQKLYELQLRHESYELDFELNTTEFPVRRGQHIGNMGNTGYSFGPHLHFELRRTSDEMLMNPLLFGYDIQDTRPPKMQGIRLYALDENNRELEAANYSLRKKNGYYSPLADTLRVKGPKAGIALSAIDEMDMLTNKNGIYRLEMFVDQQLYFSYQMDSFPRSETRFLNAHTDYDQYMYKGNYFHRLFRLPGNRVDLYPFIFNNGVIPLDRENPVHIKILAYDFHKNMSISTFYLSSDTIQKVFNTPPHDYFLPCREQSIIREDSIVLNFLDSTFYEDQFFILNRLPYTTSKSYSSVYHVHKKKIPLQQSYKLSILPRTIPAHLKSKAIIVECSSNNYINYGGKWENNLLSTRLRTFGDFCVMIDTIPPKISMVKFYKTATKSREFRFQISDNISGSSRELSNQVRAEIDGRWVPGTFNHRNGVLVLDISSFKGKDLKLTITATDSQGNKQQWSDSFSR
jgi:hypothetical protein